MEVFLPFGRKYCVIERPEEIELKANKLSESGYLFEAEVLTTGQVSFECLRRNKDEDVETLSCEICSNGSDVLDAVDSLITKAYKRSGL